MDTTYIDRMVLELEELGQKLDKLKEFYDGNQPKLNVNQQALLAVQYHMMEGYRDALAARIKIEKEMTK